LLCFVLLFSCYLQLKASFLRLIKTHFCRQQIIKTTLKIFPYFQTHQFLPVTLPFWLLFS
jgi:hypothetical protein